MTSHQSHSARVPDWFQGHGRNPLLRWHFSCPDPLVHLAHSRESGDFFAACGKGQLLRIDRHGALWETAELDGPIIALDWSDDGSRGAVIVGGRTIHRLNPALHTDQVIPLPEDGLGLAVSPYGNHLAVGLTDGTTVLYGEKKRPLARFVTARPLAFLEFCTTQPVLFGAAAHGLICCHTLEGALVWQQSNYWSNAGRMRITGNGDPIYLAGFGQGVQAFDGDGHVVGNYALDGTTNRLDCSFAAGRLVAGTVERTLHWMDSTGEMIWSSLLDDDIIELVCDPLGEWAVCGLAHQGLYALGWEP